MAPARLWLQHGMAMKGHWDAAARMGVQGVSSSAWLEMRNEPGGKVPS